MAFIFVPNADGGFTEGDKQTNPDTGVEYIYDSGAWRALGPKIEDEFDTLDGRYATNEYVDDGDQSVKDYADDGDQSVKEYVDDAVATIPGVNLSSYLKNEGNNDLPASTNWKIRQPTSTGSSKTLIQGKDGELGLYNLKEPNESHHAATKGYVDANAGNSVSGSRPPGLRFLYQSGSGNASSGMFRWYNEGGRRLNISTTSQDFPWGTDMPRTDILYNERHTFTIWVMSNDVWKMKTTGTINRIDLHLDRMYCYVSYNVDLNGSFSAASYYITISGLF